MDEILSLLRENNALLKEIVSYIRKVDNPQFKNEEEMKNMVINLLANILLLNGNGKFQ